MFSSMATKFQMTFRKASWFFSWIAKLGDSWLFMPCSSILCLLSNLALFSGWTAWQKLQAVPGYPKFPASVEVHAQENSVMASPRCLAIFQHICKYDETNILFFSTMASRQHPQKYWNMLGALSVKPLGCWLPLFKNHFPGITAKWPLTQWPSWKCMQGRRHTSFGHTQFTRIDGLF